MPPANMLPTQISEEEYPLWLTLKVDTVVSIILVFVASFSLAFGLLLGTVRFWSGVPLLLISLVAFGISCLGLRRLFVLQKRK